MHNVIFSIFSSKTNSKIKIFTSAQCSQKPSLYVTRLQSKRKFLYTTREVSEHNGSKHSPKSFRQQTKEQDPSLASFYCSLLS